MKQTPSGKGRPWKFPLRETATRLPDPPLGQVLRTRDDVGTEHFRLADGTILLTIEETSRVLDVTPQTVRNYLRRNLPYYVIRGKTLVRKPDALKLLKSKETGKNERIAKAAPPHLAARCFDLFEEGVSPVEVVRRTSIEPHVVRALFEEFHVLKGSVVLSARHLEEIEAFPWVEGIFPVTTGEELMDILRHSRLRPCATCKERVPRICPTCSTERVKRAIRGALERRGLGGLDDTETDETQEQGKDNMQ